MLILMASARVPGNTSAAVDAFRSQFEPKDTSLIDLASLNLRPFAYQRPRQNDGFMNVVEEMTAHRYITFATPVYWYAMSGPMKNFFDRLSDLLSDPEPKTLGRALAGRAVALLATGSDEELPTGFAEPFSRTAEYFKMAWRGTYYVRSNKGGVPDAQELTKARSFAASLRVVEATTTGVS